MWKIWGCNLNSALEASLPRYRWSQPGHCHLFTPTKSGKTHNAIRHGRVHVFGTGGVSWTGGWPTAPGVVGTAVLGGASSVAVDVACCGRWNVVSSAEIGVTEGRASSGGRMRAFGVSEGGSTGIAGHTRVKVGVATGPACWPGASTPGEGAARAWSPRPSASPTPNRHSIAVATRARCSIDMGSNSNWRPEEPPGGTASRPGPAATGHWRAAIPTGKR
jgi:hypothetical protein